MALSLIGVEDNQTQRVRRRRSDRVERAWVNEHDPKFEIRGQLQTPVLGKPQ